MRSLVLVIGFLVALTNDLNAQNHEDADSRWAVMQSQIQEIRDGTCDKILGVLKKNAGRYAAMTCSISLWGNAEEERLKIRWLITLEFPAHYRYRLDQPEYIESLREWKTYGLRVYDPEWALVQGKYAFEYIDQLRDRLGYLEPDEWIVSLDQYWYNRDLPQSSWYTGTKTPGKDIAWEMLPDGKKQIQEMEAQNRWRNAIGS